MEVGIRIGDRKYLNEYTPFWSVSLWVAKAGVQVRQSLDESENISAFS